jgi:tRNA A37 threonylcarbamoyltransferase TsaD
MNSMGGVVPDLATREHVRHFAPLLARAQSEVGFTGITEVAVTNGPGLGRLSGDRRERGKGTGAGLAGAGGRG